MIADEMPSFSDRQTAYLPITVVAELKLNSVIPPPDTIEEVRKVSRPNPLEINLIHIPQPNVWR